MTFNVLESTPPVKYPKTYPKGYIAQPIVTIILIVSNAVTKALLVDLVTSFPASP